MVVMVKNVQIFLDVSNIQIYTDVLNAAVVSINNVMILNWQYTSYLAFVSSVLGNGDLLAVPNALKCNHTHNLVLITVNNNNSCCGCSILRWQ